MGRRKRVCAREEKKKVPGARARAAKKRATRPRDAATRFASATDPVISRAGARARANTLPVSDDRYTGCSKRIYDRPVALSGVIGAPVTRISSSEDVGRIVNILGGILSRARVQNDNFDAGEKLASP